MKLEYDQLLATLQQKNALLQERSEDINRLTIANSNAQEEAARARLVYGADLERARSEKQREVVLANGERNVLKQSLATSQGRESALNAE
eukprot:6535916-Alexandrium_andersonii.AAC.1